MGRRREQEHVTSFPPEPAEAAVRGRAAGEGFRELVTVRLADAAAFERRAQLVRLVEDRNVVRRHPRVPKRLEHPLAHQCVDRHDHEVARRAQERIGRASVGSGEDAKLQAEQGTELPLPVADESRRRDDEDPTDASAQQHFANVEPGHDGLPGPCVVRQQETQRVLIQHSLVDGDSLMGKRMDAGRLACECGIELVSVGETQSFRYRGDGFRAAREVERRRGC